MKVSQAQITVNGKERAMQHERGPEKPPMGSGQLRIHRDHKKKNTHTHTQEVGYCVNSLLPVNVLFLHHPIGVEFGPLVPMPTECRVGLG